MASVPRTTARLCRCARVLVLPEHFAQPDQVHERQAAQIQHDVAHAVGFQLQAVDDLGNLRDRDKVQFTTKRDQGRAALRASLDGQLLSAVRLGSRRSGGFR
jgi:hypothetical protein